MSPVEESKDRSPSTALAVIPKPPVDDASPFTGIPDAKTMHDLAKSAGEAEHSAILVRIRSLRAIYDYSLHLDLGYPSFEMYCDREFGKRRSTALECVRVAHALDELPRLRAVFASGDLSWGQVRAITRIANVHTEIQWIELAFEVSVRTLAKRVAQAKMLGRDTPPPKEFGLPNVYVQWTARITLEERERLETALKQVAKSCDWDENDRRHPLIRLADALLAGVVQIGPESTSGRPAPAQTILYRTCAKCRETTVETSEGPVIVDAERVEELAPDSNRVVIEADEELPVPQLPPGEVDSPNSARLTRQVLHRDGLECANPGCDRTTGLQAHHIVFRSNGGPSALSNEVTVCRRCHAAIHHGLLDVTGNADDGFLWKPRPANPAAQLRDVEVVMQRVREMEVKLGPMPTPRGDGTARYVPGAPPPPPIMDDGRFGDLVDSVVRLGWSRKEAKERVQRAIVELLAEQRESPDWTGTPQVPSDKEILRRAMLA